MKSIQLTLFFLLFTSIAFSQKATVGAIRWDAWTGSTNSVGVQVERTLGPNAYHYRVPFYGRETATDSVTINACTQAIMDQEITYAANAGLDYWAFVWYPAASGMDQSRNLYKSSSLNQSVKYCLVIEPSNWITNISIDSIVNNFKSTNYQKVQTNRPLLYLFGYSGILKKDVDTLRARTIRAGLGTPYIVEMRVDGVMTTVSTLGLDAFSLYATSWLGNGITYDSLANTDIIQWNYTGLSLGIPTVPHVTTGWDKRPRHDHNVTWEGDPGANAWVQRPTPGELAYHITEAKNWCYANPTVATANTAIVYAWNEFDEGGWICPTITVGNNTVANTTILDSIAPALAALPPTPNLALNKTYTSSSNWNTAQNAPKAFDGNYGTDWQAQSGSNFSSQWLQVYFGTNTKFNKVVLSEYGNRTTGYRIEYSSNGSTWQTAYTGTTIGTSKTVTFTAVTAKYARIKFTAGSLTPIIYEFEIYNTTGSRPVAPANPIQPMISKINKVNMDIYPNPSVNSAAISYSLTKASDIVFNVYNNLGMIVKSFELKAQTKGVHQYNFYTTGLKAGNYFVKLITNERSVAKPLIILQ